MRKIVAILAIAVLITGLSGCSYVFYPRADDYAQEAKGATSIETVLNLTTVSMVGSFFIQGIIIEQRPEPFIMRLPPKMAV